MGKGIASIIGAGVSDVGSALAEAATLGKAETDSNLLPIAKAMGGFTEEGFHPTQSVIIQDLVNRYGPLAPGGRPASEFLQELYDNPLAFGLDAASVASLGAKAASIGGRTALKGADTLAAAEEAAAAMKAAGVPARAAEAASIRQGLDQLVEAGSLSGPMTAARRLLPRPTYRVLEAGPDVASHFIPSTEAYNPFNRLFTTPIRKLLTEPVEKLGNEAEMLRSTMKSGALGEAIAPNPRAIATTKLYDEILTGAAERGMSRIDIPVLRKNLNPTFMAKRIEKTLAADSLRLREKEAKEMHDLIVQAAEEDRTFDHANMETYHITSQGLDVNVDGMRAEPWAEARYGVGGDQGKAISLADAPDMAVNTELAPEVRSVLTEDPLLQRVDAAVERLRDVRARFDDPQMAEWGWDVTREQGAIDRIIRSLNRSLERRAAGYDNPATKLSDHARVIDIENRLPMLENLEATPMSYLNRLYGPIQQKYLTSGERALLAEAPRPDVPPSPAATIPEAPAAAAPLSDEAAMAERFQSSADVKALIPDDHPEVQAARQEIIDAKIKAYGTPRSDTFMAAAKDRAHTAILKKAKAEGRWTKGEELWDGSAPSALQREILADAGVPIERAAPAEAAGAVAEAVPPTPQAAAVLTEEAPPRTLRGIEPDPPDALLLDDAFYGNDLVQPSYFPHIRNEGAKGGSDFFPVKRAAGANILARDPHEARFFGTLMKEGNYITDPMEAFTRRAARRAREVNTYNSWSTRIKRMGRVVTDAEQIPDGWVAVSPDALFLKHRIHMQFIEKLEDYRLNGMDPDAAFAQALDDVGQRTLDDLDTLLGEGKPQVYAIPKALDEEMGAAAKWARAGGGKYVRAAYDPFMNTWRSLVLTGSPRWVVNNILGNTVMGAMQGVKVADVARILGERLRALFAKWAQDKPWLAGVADAFGPPELREKSLAARVETLPYEGLTGSGFFGKNNLEQYRPNLGKDAAETKIGRFVQGTRTPGTKANTALTLPRRFSDAVRSLNGEIEASFREASFLTAVEKQQGRNAIQRTGRTFWKSDRRINDIMKNGYDEAAARAAVEEVDHFFGNYTALGPFERHVIRRWLVPFWGFYKHTVKLMMTFPVQYPLRAQVLRGLTLATQEMIKEYGPLPSWLESAIPLSPPGGEVSFLRTAGANPFTGMFEDPTQMLSPAIKMFLEQSTGKDMFTGEGFTDANTYTPFGSDQAYNLQTLQPVAAPRPGILEHLLSQVPQYDMLKKAVAGGTTYDTATLLDALQGKGVILDPDTGEPKYPQSVIEQLQKLSGFNTQPYDVGAYQEMLTEDQKAALTEALKRMAAQEMAS
jgi:hypothetical protein